MNLYADKSDERSETLWPHPLSDSLSPSERRSARSRLTYTHALRSLLKLSTLARQRGPFNPSEAAVCRTSDVATSDAATVVATRVFAPLPALCHPLTGTKQASTPSGTHGGGTDDAGGHSAALVLHKQNGRATTCCCCSVKPGPRMTPAHGGHRNHTWRPRRTRPPRTERAGSPCIACHEVTTFKGGIT